MSNADATHYDILSPVTWSDEADADSSVVEAYERSSPVAYDRQSVAGRSNADSGSDSDSDSDETLEPAPVAHSLELESPPAPIRPIHDDNSELGRTVSPQFARAHELRIRALRESVRRRQRALETVWSSPTRKRQEEAPQEFEDYYHQEPQNEDSIQGSALQNHSSPIMGQDISDELIQTARSQDDVNTSAVVEEQLVVSEEQLQDSDVELADEHRASLVSDHSSHYESFSPEKSFYDLESRPSASIKLKPQILQTDIQKTRNVLDEEPEQPSSPLKPVKKKLKDSPKAISSPRRPTAAAAASPNKSHLSTPSSSNPAAARSPAFEDWTPAQWTRLVKDARLLNLRKQDIDVKTPLPPTLLRHFPGSSDYSLRLRLQTLFSRKKI